MAKKVQVEISAVDKTKQAFNSVNKSLGGLKNAFAGLASAFSVGAITKIVTDVSSATDEINKLSTQLGISTEALSEYQFVAQQTGVEFRTFTTGLQRMERRVAEAARGTGEAKNALNELGVSAKVLTTLAPEEQFEALADALNDVKDPAEKVRIAFKLFDSDGVKLLRTMEGGSEAIRTYRAEAEKLGVSIGQDTADKFTAFEDSLGKLRTVMKASAIETATIFLPAFKAVVDFLAVFLPKAAKIASRELERSRAAVLRFAGGVFEAFGADEQAGIARRAAAKFTQSVQDINNELKDYKLEIGEGVNAAGLFDNSLKNIAATTERNKAALKEYNKALAEAKGIFESTRTPAEKLEATLRRLNELGDRGLLSDETVARGIQKAREEFQAADPATQAYLNRLREAQSIFDGTRTKLEEFSIEVAKVKELFDEGLISDDTAQRRINELAEATKQIKEETDKVDGAYKDLGLTFASAFEDAIVEGEKFSDVLKGLEQDIIRILARKLVTEPLANAATGFLGGLFPARAIGGPVTAGSPFIVGEQGPEVFVPNTAGKVSQVSPSINISINNSAPAGNYQSDMQLAAKVGQAVSRAMRRNT